MITNITIRLWIYNVLGKINMNVEIYFSVCFVMRVLTCF